MADRCDHCSVRMDGLEVHAEDCPVRGPEILEESEKLKEENAKLRAENESKQIGTSAHKARLEIIAKLGYAPSSIAGADWIVHKVEAERAAAKEALDAALREVKEWKDAAYKEREYSLGVEKNRDAAVLQNQALQNRIDAAKVLCEHILQGSLRTEMEIKIVEPVLRRLTGEEVTPTQKPKCEHEANEAHGPNSFKCGKCGEMFSLAEKRIEPSQKEPLIPCPNCGFFHGPDCVRPVRK